MSLLMPAQNSAYDVGQMHGHFVKTAKDAVGAPVLSGRLYLSQSGWLLLSVPNGMVRGVFATLNEEGLELPPGKNGNPYNAHISVMRQEEVEALGGGDKITERGKVFHYQLGPLKVVDPLGWEEISKCWFIEVKSPELQNLRKSYGLSGLPQKNGEELPFHITVAVRRKHVLRANEVSKAAVHWSKDVDRDILNNKPYPTSFLTGELGELLSAIKNRDWTNIKEELSDSLYAGQSLLAQRTGLNLPLLGSSSTVNKFYDRKKKWEDMFRQQGLEFNNDYLVGGSNLKKPHKIQQALALAGRTITPDDAATLSQQYGGGVEKESDDEWEKLPYRERAEMFALSPDKKLYGGIWDSDKSFALPGGGVDPGEDVPTGAAREFLEETGMQVKNPRLLPIEPVTDDWSPERRANKPADRRNFRGSRTHFVAADLEDAQPVTDKLDSWPAGDKRFYSLAEALAHMAGKTPMSPTVFAARQRALQHLLSAAEPAAKQGSFAGDAWRSTPLRWQSGLGFLGNIKSHLARLSEQTNRKINERRSLEDYYSYRDPAYRMQRAINALNGTPNVQTTPLDRLLASLPDSMPFFKTSNAIRDAVKVVEKTTSSSGLSRKFSLMLGDKDIGQMLLRTGSKLLAGGQVASSNIDDKYRGLGLGRKFYGEVMRRMPGQMLHSDSIVSDAAQRIWNGLVRDRPHLSTISREVPELIKARADALQAFTQRQLREQPSWARAALEKAIKLKKQPFELPDWSDRLTSRTSSPLFSSRLPPAAALKTAATISQLRKIKEHSDKKQYGRKHQLLRTMLRDKPDDWDVGEDRGMASVTHKPTGYRFHLPKAVVPS